jgi:diguanylate cyclase (GGDEF)-like protein/PAS domain S-box-containing protein
MNKRLLQDFAEIASDWFWESDHEHRFTYFSKRLEEVTGVPSKEFLGKSRMEIPLLAHDEIAWTNHLEDLKACRPFRNFVYKANRPSDGSEFWVRISGQPVFSLDGTFEGYRGTGSDVTNEVVGRQAIEERNELLARQNAELAAAKQTIERMVYEDPLTGIKNRRYMEARLHALIEQGHKEVIALHIDLDMFKRINDTLGHAAGDEVLRVVGQRLEDCCEGSDVGRMGGDEFLVLLTGPGLQEAQEQANAVVTAVDRPVTIEGDPVRTGASIGIAQLGTAAKTGHELLSCADLALYEAKKLGRNRAIVFTSELHQRQLEQRQLAHELHQAVEQDEFEVWFQPQFDATAAQLSGAEALIRWCHPTRGVVQPDCFLPVAEDIGLIAALDTLVLRKSLAFANRLADAGMPLPRLSVNVSFGRLNDSTLVDEVTDMWTDKRTQLAFELVETVLFDGETSEVIEHTLDRLREMGVALEIDDFGTGHASMTALLHVQPDNIKIDRSLVRNIVENHDHRRMVRAIVEMAEAIGLGVIAEGVETADHARCLAELGCAHLQGFYFARPMAAPDFADFIAAARPRPVSLGLKNESIESPGSLG